MVRPLYPVQKATSPPRWPSTFNSSRTQWLVSAIAYYDKHKRWAQKGDQEVVYFMIEQIRASGDDWLAHKK